MPISNLPGIYAILARIFSRRPDLAGEPPLATLSRALIDQNNVSTLEVAADGSVYSPKSGITIVDSKGLLPAPPTVSGTLPSPNFNTSPDEVQYLGTPIESSHYTGQSAANLADDDLTTDWASGQPNTGWAGYDFGAAVTPTRYRYGTWLQSDGAAKELILGEQVQSGNDSGFASPVTVDTISTLFPYCPRFQYNNRALASVSGARYWRVTNNTVGSYGGALAELQFFGPRTTSVNCRPVSPTLSLWGGRFPNTSVVATRATSTTAAASFIYTLDGTTPTVSNGTFTDGPILVPLTAGATVTLKVIAYDSTCSTPASQSVVAYFSGYGYKPRDDWYDDHGVLIEAHNGMVLNNFTRDGRYYWYGTLMNQYQTGTVTPNDLEATHGLRCYSSADALNWRDEGQILDQPPGWGLVINAQVIFVAALGKYVLWSHGYNLPSVPSNARACIATANSPTGPWTWVATTVNPDGFGLGDFCLFQDDDGTAYIVYTTNGGEGMHISKLASNALQTTGIAGDRTVISATGAGESPVLFKRQGVYFLIYSGVGNYYNSANTFSTSYGTASTLLGAWTVGLNPFASSQLAGNPVGTNFNGQTRGVFTLAGKPDAFVWCGDYWTQPLYGSRQVWLPLKFPTATTLQIEALPQWDQNGR